MKQLASPKRNHHILPKLYLKGFIEAPDQPFVWVYQRDKSYKPGSKSHHNPQRLPLKKVGAEKDHFAFKKRDGSIDFDKYENKFEKLEKPSDNIFRKLRNYTMITDQEKEVFSKYIYHMFKRISKRNERFKNNWPKIYTNVSSKAFNFLGLEEANTPKDDLLRLAQIQDARNEAEQHLEFYRENFLDSEIPLQVMVTESHLKIPEGFSAMTWQFYLAPLGYEYVTGDNPIFNPGLNKWHTEISFPISKDVALIMSWHKKNKEGFFLATPEIVMEINQRTLSNAHKEIYSSSLDSGIVDLFKGKRKGYNLIYPYSGNMFD